MNYVVLVIKLFKQHTVLWLHVIASRRRR